MVVIKLAFYTLEGEKIVKVCVQAGLALLAGAALGGGWGALARLVPHARDAYVTELRILFVLIGGLFANFFTSALGWGGTGETLFDIRNFVTTLSYLNKIFFDSVFLPLMHFF